MSVTDTTAPVLTMTRTGQANSAGDSSALFLKVYAGEVLTAFEQASVTMDKHVVRSISSGISAQFPLVWKTAATEYAYINGSGDTGTTGIELDGTIIHKNEKVISIDGLLIADHFVNNLDEAMSHFEVRSIYAKEAGIALGTQWDQNVLQQGVLGARSSTLITSGNGGSVLTNASYGTSGSTLGSGLFDAAEQLDENNVPENDRYMYVRPAQYYLMAETTDLINRDWGGRGVYAEGEVMKVAGIHIVKTNNLPITNISSSQVTTHDGNFSTTKALVMHKSSVATVKLLNLAVETEYAIKNQGWIIVAKYAMGHGFIRPEGCVEFKTS
jgi:hypothetical protein|tara:strand:- start:36 stop:1016 length:981 start_codon:yes stop_codon:yes gene_type:complete